ncbi:hypothetical protein [Porphyromonas sp.]|uniref:hypothetical protein n=1 Tax=Porphyromonas sp. TaxID=1924944 RepID=UPI0026DACD77|nr:hypothetical protein [Porphyromonas sp.]MDO4770559.1 hypothetical protein [Porphyromonas sp.]
MKRFIVMATVLLMLLSCQEKSQQQIEAGAKWLESLIINADGEVCVDSTDEELVMTPRLREFFNDALRIYGPSNMDENELKAAEQAYKEKWKDIYPIKEDDHKLFGKGNGETTSLYDLKVTHKEGLVYNVYIRYGRDYVYNTEVTLIPHEGAFQIDYASVEYSRAPGGDQEGIEPYWSLEDREARKRKFEEIFTQSEEGEMTYEGALLTELAGFTNPEEVTEKWGKPLFECKISYPKDNYYYTTCGITHSSFVTYEPFEASWVHFEYNPEYQADPSLTLFSTNREGFGFAGLYVGVPECNKEAVIEYLGNWFGPELLSLYDKEEHRDEMLVVRLSQELPIEMVIVFSEDGLIKSMEYSPGTCM